MADSVASPHKATPPSRKRHATNAATAAEQSTTVVLKRASAFNARVELEEIGRPVRTMKQGPNTRKQVMHFATACMHYS